MPKYHAHHVSLQWKDSNTQTEKDIRAAFKRGAHLVSFTEMFAGNLKILRRVCKQYGYKVAVAAGNDAICLKKRLKVHDFGSTVVNKPQRGKPPLAGHSQRRAVWVQFGFRRNRVFHVTGHWVTGFHKNEERREKHEDMSEEFVSLVQNYGKGAGLAFFSGDINMDDSRGINAGFRILAEGGLTTCWDEMGVYPATHGKGKTIDIIGSYDKDKRVTCIKARAWPKRNSDHNPVSAIYRIKRRKRK